MGAVLWLLSPAAVLAGACLLGISAVLLIAWGLIHRETGEWRQMDEAYWASQRAARSRRDRGNSSRRRSPRL
jgi:hypothetical protein